MGLKHLKLEQTDFSKHIAYIYEAHQRFAKSKSKSIRYWDQKTPYAIHPIWCAMTLLTETKLDEPTRINGSVALLYHDLLEDTKKKLPAMLPVEVQELVKKMTFSSFEEEKRLIFKSRELIILLKLYDKTFTLLDNVWMKPKQAREYADYTKKLLLKTKKKYGNLNIVMIARTLLKKYGI